MAKAKRYEVEGTLEWVRVFEDNRDMEGFQGAYEDCDGAYTLDAILDKENTTLFKASGTAKKGRETEDGEFAVKFVRKHIGPFKKVGGPPVVVWDDGTPYDFDDEGTIGNGSTGRILFEVYPTKAGINGTRLVKLTIIGHVAYVPMEDEDGVPV